MTAGPPSSAAGPHTAVDWSRAHEEALEHFRALLRIDTTNPPGNEAEATAWLSRLLGAEGISHEVVESAPGRASLVARLPSAAPFTATSAAPSAAPSAAEPCAPSGPGLAGASDSGADALLLSAHLDVVPAEPSRWRHPPFAAELHDGCVWGRGAIDMKHMAIYGLMTLLLLKRSGIHLRRDVVFAAVADEEAGSFLGAEWLVRRRPDLLRGCRYALNEVGGFTVHMQGRRIYPIQVAEKGFAWMTLRARGEPGHGSLPAVRNPVTALARALDRLAARELPYRLTPPVERFMRDLARELGPPASLVLRGLLGRATSGAALKLLPDPDVARVFRASLHDTANATVLRAGGKVNVVPGEAEAELDGRFLPGIGVEEFLEEVRRAAGVKGGTAAGGDLELVVRASGRPVEASADTALFRHLASVLARRDPGAAVLPNLVVGFTDAHAYAELGLTTYGFSPIRLPPDLRFAALYHGHDERIPVDGFRWGLETFFEAVCGWVAGDGA